MSDDCLVQRKKWFRYFPEGSIEFILVTRVLGVAGLLALGVLPGAQRSLLLVALGGVLWLDHVLTQWWAIQLSTDLAILARRPASSAADAGRNRWAALLLAALPTTILIAALVPWPNDIPILHVALGSFTRRFLPLWLVLFFVLLWPAGKALCRVLTGPMMWTFLLLVPVLHWLATHRLLAYFHERIGEVSRAAGGADPTDEGYSRAAVAFADATWIMTLLPWIGWVGAIVARGQWPDRMPLSLLPNCGTLLAAVFAVANLAAMEALQRRFIALIRQA